MVLQTRTFTYVEWYYIRNNYYTWKRTKCTIINDIEHQKTDENNVNIKYILHISNPDDLVNILGLILIYYFLMIYIIIRDYFLKFI